MTPAEAKAGLAKIGVSEKDIQNYVKQAGQGFLDWASSGAYSRCSGSNKKKYDRMIRMATRQQLESWLRAGGGAGTPGTGNCEKYLLEQAFNRWLSMEAQAKLDADRRGRLRSIGRFSEMVSPVAGVPIVSQYDLSGIRGGFTPTRKRSGDTTSSLLPLLLFGGIAYAVVRRK